MVRAPGTAQRTAAAFAAAVVLLVVLAVAATVAARTRWWFPPLASLHGRAVDTLFAVTFGIIAVAFVLVHALLALFVWRYREHPERRAAHWHDHRALELTYTLVPAVVLVSLTLAAARLWAGIHSPPPAGALAVEVRAEQFGWLARYPGPDGVFGRVDPAQYDRRRNPMALDRSDPAGRDDIVTTELHLVVGRPAAVRLRSKDVIHSFFLAELRVKQDAVPGVTVVKWFVPTRVGTFEIACAELCGVGHYAMRGRLVVQSQAAFDAWLAAQGRR
ncbi:MAG: cytochrome c oxidase subunit II [Armatimonadota bacterium]|nr:cytochrome c oxidase subunit II [Armatimonadota bacterium]MDR7448653.1 cytochrome c oxidase subunit II [Armatimonadota bacterium]MDR7460313.1 cytochrome c oxidase subunit II [Armatimonadota bacterium]MDR7478997.1 cytochrome c oxidase subunit II [Armatimonadota bacterium]MDR7488484.1 cytochrome c oxidase subunit II [Armatimonadota bacterium]